MLILIKDPGDRISFANLCGTWNVLKIGCLCNEKCMFSQVFPMLLIDISFIYFFIDI